MAVPRTAYRPLGHFHTRARDWTASRTAKLTEQPSNPKPVGRAPYPAGECLQPMHADLVANLPISIWRQTVDDPAGKERPCGLRPPEMVNAHGLSTSVSNDAGLYVDAAHLRTADAHPLVEGAISTGPNLIQGKRTEL